MAVEFVLVVIVCAALKDGVVANVVPSTRQADSIVHLLVSVFVLSAVNQSNPTSIFPVHPIGNLNANDDLVAAEWL